MLVRLLLGLIAFYQKAISPLTSARCRFYPTCSTYGKHALQWHGVRGIPILFWRILRCQPFGGSGVDFVPLPLYRYQFVMGAMAVHFVYKSEHDYVAFRNHLMKC